MLQIYAKEIKCANRKVTVTLIIYLNAVFIISVHLYSV